MTSHDDDEIEIMNRAHHAKTNADRCEIYEWNDILQLADVIMGMAELAFKDYHLNLLKYPTHPALTWDAWLKTSKASVGTVHDRDSFFICKSMERGGLSQIRIPHFEINQPPLPNYRPNLPYSEAHYNDFTSMYPTVMRMKNVCRYTSNRYSCQRYEIGGRNYFL